MSRLLWQAARRRLRGLRLTRRLPALAFGLVLAATLGLSWLRPSPVAAAGVMIRPDLPADNRVPQASGYFDLTLKPGQSRTVTITVANPTATAQTVAVRLLTGVTPVDGQAQYLSAKAAAEWLTAPAPSRALKVPRQVRLAAGTTSRVAITIPAAVTRSRGTQLMAVQLTAQPPASGTVRNRTRYLVGLVLHGQAAATAAPRLSAITSSTAGPDRLTVTVTRPAARFMQDATVTLAMTPATVAGVSYRQTWSARRLAPTSRGQWRLPLTGMKLAPGTYALTWTAEQGRVREQARRYVRIDWHGHAHFISATAYRWTQRGWGWGLALASVLVVTLALLGWRHRRRKRSNEKTDRALRLSPDAAGDDRDEPRRDHRTDRLHRDGGADL